MLILVHGATMWYCFQEKKALIEAFSADEMSQVSYGKAIACCGFLDQRMY